ncbi:MAG: LacI family DNA-binding transcriptional regulator, partial [Propionibacteriaceae bacterium]
KSVSNVINGYATVSLELRRRVEAAADELGYRPNLLARALRSGAGGLVTIVLPERSPHEIRDLTARLTQVAVDLGYSVVTDRADTLDGPSCVVVMPSGPTRR